MLKEEKELRKYCSETMSIIGSPEQYHWRINALVRACYEDAAKVAEDSRIGAKGTFDVYDEIAAAIRGKGKG
jgi:hypothetical protein